MLSLLKTFGLIYFTFLALFFFLRWISISCSKLRNPVAFIVSCGSSYAIGFVVDMLVCVLAGKLQFRDIVFPVITWGCIGLGCYYLAWKTATSNRMLYIPYLINAAIAISAGMVHGWNLLTGLVLVLLAFVMSQVNTEQGIQDNPEALRTDTGTFAHENIWRKSNTLEDSALPLEQEFSIGRYFLNMPIHGLPNLIEASQKEYSQLSPRVDNAKIYHAPLEYFLGWEWQILLGVLDGRVYKIAASVELHDEEEFYDLITRTLNFCSVKLGEPTEQANGMLVWDMRSGNVIMQFFKLFDTFGISLFLTSNIVATHLELFS